MAKIIVILIVKTLIVITVKKRLYLSENKRFQNNKKMITGSDSAFFFLTRRQPGNRFPNDTLRMSTCFTSTPHIYNGWYFIQRLMVSKISISICKSHLRLSGYVSRLVASGRRSKLTFHLIFNHSESWVFSSGNSHTFAHNSPWNKSFWVRCWVQMWSRQQKKLQRLSSYGMPVMALGLGCECYKSNFV